MQTDPSLISDLEALPAALLTLNSALHLLQCFHSTPVIRFQHLHVLFSHEGVRERTPEDERHICMLQAFPMSGRAFLTYVVAAFQGDGYSITTQSILSRTHTGRKKWYA